VRLRAVNLLFKEPDQVQELLVEACLGFKIGNLSLSLNKPSQKRINSLLPGDHLALLNEELLLLLRDTGRGGQQGSLEGELDRPCHVKGQDLIEE